MNLKKRYLRLIITIALVFLKLSFSFSQSLTKLSGYAQGTSYSILYYSDKSPLSASQADSIFYVLDSSLSIYKKYSLISEFNKLDVSSVKMDEHIKKVIESSIRHWKNSKGLFDITVGPLTDLYGFGNKNKLKPPTELEINEALKKVGSNYLMIQGDTLIKKVKGLKIDVNGIAQGYSVDIIATFLEKSGVQNYLVEVGGEIRTKGTHIDGNKFKIAIEVPTYENDSLKSTYLPLEIKNLAITTSGSIYKGKQHIHPRTGLPYITSTQSVTVIAPTAMEADALDNYLIAMPYKKALRWVKKHKGIEILIVHSKKEKLVISSSRFFKKGIIRL